MEKLYNENGEVAVVYSSNFGAGWSTCNDEKNAEFLLFDKTLAQMVLDEAPVDQINDYVKTQLRDPYFYGGTRDLEIKWLKPGTRFRIDVYDGNEHVELLDRITFQVA